MRIPNEEMKMFRVIQFTMLSACILQIASISAQETQRAKEKTKSARAAAGSLQLENSKASPGIRVQLQWTPQAQFAGEIAAQAKGYYAAENLRVTLVPGGPAIDVIAAGSAPDGPEFTLSWVPKALAAVENGKSDLVSIAQIFQRSGIRSISWKASNIDSADDFKGKKIGVWGFGNEHEIVAGARRHGLKPGVDYEKIIQDFGMEALLKHQVDAAAAMSYNEFGQLLETKNPATGRLYQPQDFNVIDWNAEGTAMLQDAIFARKSWLAQPGHEDIAVRFLRATFKGWMFCRDNPSKAVDYVVKVGTRRGRGHQVWQLNEVNPLIWPSPNGIGITDQHLWDQTVKIAMDGGVLKSAPALGAFRNDLAEKALAGIAGDVKGKAFKKGTAVVTEGGN
jgi:NitT/TauT family transport system substrate-binding protein